jgi:hypothetical protein
MASKGMIQINYEMPFEGMLVQTGVAKHQREKIFRQLGSKEIKFPHKGKSTFLIKPFHFNQAILTRTVAKLIRTDDGWKPFDIEHLLAYFEKNPSRFRSNLVFASRRTFDVLGTPHIFVLTMERDRPDLELVPDNHAWAPHISIFPGQRKTVT